MGERICLGRILNFYKEAPSLCLHVSSRLERGWGLLEGPQEIQHTSILVQANG